jgi:dinuclear metal center YbgI/SA1388 family protein
MLPAVALAEVAAYIDELLDVRMYTEEAPSNGLLVDAGKPVMRIAAAVNTSFRSIRGASEAGAQLLLVHHTTWEHLDLHLKPEKERALRSVGVSLYGAHAALDCWPEHGNPDSLARLVGVEVERRFLDWAGGQPGVIGRADGGFERFVAGVQSALDAPVQSWRNNASFGRVAIVTGAGGQIAMVNEAHRLGCDTFLTGEGSMDTKRFARELGINLVFGTHYATEAPGIKALAERVAGHFQLPWTFVPEDPDIL